jgi:hypothetical protein
MTAFHLPCATHADDIRPVTSSVAEEGVLSRKPTASVPVSSFRVATPTYGHTDDHSWLRLVGVDEDPKVQVVNVQIRPEIGALGRDRFHDISEPPDDGGAGSWIGRDDKQWFA